MSSSTMTFKSSSFSNYSLEHMEGLIVNMREISQSPILLSALHLVQAMILWSSHLNLIFMNDFLNDIKRTIFLQYSS